MASIFNKSHANCATRMADELSEKTIQEAFRQKRRINDAVTKRLQENIKRAREDDDDRPVSKRRNTAVDTACTFDAPRREDYGNEDCTSGMHLQVVSLDKILMKSSESGSLFVISRQPTRSPRGT